MRHQVIGLRLGQAARHFSYSRQLGDGVGSGLGSPNEDGSSWWVFYQDEQGDVVPDVKEAFRVGMLRKLIDLTSC